MKKQITLVLVLLLYNTVAQAQTDKTDCRDHDMFNRMPGFYIYECRQSEYEEQGFYSAAEGSMQVGGRFYYLGYALKQGATPASSLQIIENFNTALQKLEAKVIYKSTQQIDAVISKPNAETWISVQANADSYRIKIIQKENRQQVIEANADFLQDQLNTNGKVALYGILFDTGKSTIRPEAHPLLAEIARLIQTNNIALFVVGHTDNTGDYAQNLRLSQARAEAVIQYLVSSHKISSARLTAFGAGPVAPVASNKTEEGKQLNRRVELVIR
ncbi:MAG: OmpA family protein [Cyclobacteriaceae bacterium]|jgi:outer membrane protein OmpA-like peptidoglycan-associated protein|nr:OmpA family protein [Cyclobacteriaceae bacterium]